MSKASHYAVIFTSQRNNEDHAGYEKMATRMDELAREHKGFLGLESIRDEKGSGITISYWDNPENIMAWRKNSEHLIAQEFGRTKWYESFTLRVCKVEREYTFKSEA